MNTNNWTASVTALLLLGGAAHSQVTITDLELLPGGNYSSAYGINDSGKIVGVANDATGALKTVQWVNGQISVIPDLGGGLAVPEDLNDAGEAAGGQSIGGFLHLGIYWDPQNDPSLLPGLPSSSSSLVHAHAINSSGQIAGMAQEAGPNYWGHAVVWQQDSLQTDLGFMGGGNYSRAYGLNDLGAVVGVASVANTNQHAFLWQNGQYTDLSTWSGGSPSSKAYAINLHGAIVGLNANVASLWENGAVHALPMPPGVSAFTPAIDINDAGDMIATGSKGFPLEVGVLWRNGTPIDLGTLPGGTISRARRINAAGEVVGEAKAADGFFHAVKWTVSALGSTYCLATQNSSGAPADISASGSASSSASDLTLGAATVPIQPGIFFHGANQTQIPFGNGFLCATGGIVRGAVLVPGSNHATYTYDNSDPKHSLAAYVSTTRNFQYWFRDPMGGGAFFNTSNAVSIGILP